MPISTAGPRLVVLVQETYPFTKSTCRPFAVFTARAGSLICHHRQKEKAALPGDQETPIPSPHPVTVMQAVTAAIALTILCQQQYNQRHKMGDRIVPVKVVYCQQQCRQILTRGKVLLRVFMPVLAVGRATVELMEMNSKAL